MTVESGRAQDDLRSNVGGEQELFPSRQPDLALVGLEPDLDIAGRRARGGEAVGPGLGAKAQELFGDSRLLPALEIGGALQRRGVGTVEQEDEAVLLDPVAGRMRHAAILERSGCFRQALTDRSKLQ